MKKPMLINGWCLARVSKIIVRGKSSLRAVVPSYLLDSLSLKDGDYIAMKKEKNKIVIKKADIKLS